MRRKNLCSCREVCHALAILLAVHFGVCRPALAQAPMFVTQTPITGNSGNVFFVFLPVANVGSDAATNMQLTSVALTFLGSPAAAVIQPATLPFVPGSGYLGPGGVRKLDLEFDNSSLVSGNSYMVELGGTYQVNGITSAFTLTQPVVYAAGFVGTQQQLKDAILAKFQSRPRVDPQTDDQAMVTFLNGLPQVRAADLQVDPPVVSVTFNDGWEPLLLLNNVKLPSQSVLSSAAPPGSGSDPSNVALLSSALVEPSTADPAAGVVPGTELPRSNQVRILNALGSGWSTAHSTIEGWLANNGYTRVSGADASVQSLRSVGGDGVFYIGTHGAVKNSFFWLWTSTPVDFGCDPNNLSSDKCPDPKLPSDISGGYVMDLALDDVFDNGIRDWNVANHYGINSAFIFKYWQNFGENALVYIDACDSDRPNSPAQAFREVLFGKGASVFVGWTGTVFNQTAVDTAKVAFDRLLGANDFCPEDGPLCHPGPAAPPVFAQRPFDYASVQTDLPLHSLGIDVAAQIQFEPNLLAPGFGLLAPTISNMRVDETMGAGGQLIINGIFGQDPRPNGSVQVGGADAHIVKWNSNANEIVVDLTLSGPGSAGDIQVTVRGHKSNVARLTEWRSNNFTYTFMENGTLQVQSIYNLHFRADIRKYRKIIHFEPDEPSGQIFSANDSTATFTGSGSGPAIFGEGEFKLTGSGALANIFVSPTPTDNYLALAVGSVNNSTQWTFVQLDAFSLSGCTCTLCGSGGCFSVRSPVAGPSNQPNPPAGPLNYFTFILDADSANIQSGSGQLAGFMLCNNGGPGATGTFQWGSIPATPDTAPDPKSAR